MRHQPDPRPRPASSYHQRRQADEGAGFEDSVEAWLLQRRIYRKALPELCQLGGEGPDGDMPAFEQGMAES